MTDLNTRLEKPVNPEQFRPNFVIKGAAAYEEDTWGWVKIGDVIFKTVMPCTRCIFSTVDPETGTKNPKVEPLKTLKRFIIFELILSLNVLLLCYECNIPRLLHLIDILTSVAQRNRYFFSQLQTNNGSTYSPIGRRESSTGNSSWIEEF